MRNKNRIRRISIFFSMLSPHSTNIKKSFIGVIAYKSSTITNTCTHKYPSNKKIGFLIFFLIFFFFFFFFGKIEREERGGERQEERGRKRGEGRERRRVRTREEGGRRRGGGEEPLFFELFFCFLFFLGF